MFNEHLFIFPLNQHLAGHIAAHKQRLHFSDSPAAWNGQVTKFWPVRYKKSGLELLGNVLKGKDHTFLHFFFSGMNYMKEVAGVTTAILEYKVA